MWGGRKHAPGAGGVGGDAAVRLTNDDAAAARAGCAARGYLEDPHVARFVRRPSPRSPGMNRGAWARAQAVRQVLRRFLEQAHGTEGQRGESQVVVLGAGYDTTFFNLRPPRGCRWLEVDMAEVCRSKATILHRTPEMADMLGGGSPGGGGEGSAAFDLASGTVLGGSYGLAAADLRDVPALEGALNSLGVRREPPTFVLLECVLAYLPPAAGQALCRWAADFFPAGTIVIYEMTGMDAFGLQLLENLRARGCALPGFEGCPDLSAQRKRLTDSGFERVSVWDMDQIYRNFLDSSERARIEKLEFLDDPDELRLIMQHYCFVVGERGEMGGGARSWGSPGCRWDDVGARRASIGKSVSHTA